jgi:hypothetical protein
MGPVGLEGWGLEGGFTYGTKGESQRKTSNTIVTRWFDTIIFVGFGAYLRTFGVDPLGWGVSVIRVVQIYGISVSLEPTV